MDFSEPYVILGSSFLSYLATGCGATLAEMEAVFVEERMGKQSLVPFLKQRFEHSRLFEEGYLLKLEPYLEFVEPKT